MPRVSCTFGSSRIVEGRCLHLRKAVSVYDKTAERVFVSTRGSVHCRNRRGPGFENVADLRASGEISYSERSTNKTTAESSP